MEDRLLGSLTTLREALPYDEAERHWLVDIHTKLEEREDLKYRSSTLLETPCSFGRQAERC
jgi:hypothetical protein